MAWRSKVTPVAASPAIRNSMATSMASLSPSHLDTAIMEMLNIRPGDNTWNSMCKGNPITAKGKWKQICQIFSVVSIPLLILIGMTAITFGTTLQDYVNSSQIRYVLKYSTQLGTLIHSLQNERDQSALYLNMMGPKTKGRLLKAYSNTDKIIEDLNGWPVSDKNPLVHFQSKEKFQIYLNQHRYRLDSMNKTVAEEMAFYTDDIIIFVRWLFDSITEARSGTIWRSLVALLEITDAKESLGIERALGATFYARGGTPPLDDYLWFAENQDIANVSFESARRFSIIAADIYDSLVEHNQSFLENLREMRRELRLDDCSSHTGSNVKTTLWFESMSDYMDVLLETQRELIAMIILKLGETDDEDLTRVIIIAVVFAVVIFMCPLIIQSVYSLAVKMQSYSITLADRTKALKREKKRTDMLLYQMLPKTVAEQLKKNEEVKAETFAHGTIYFSNIVGFTSLTAQCSPVQVVAMLNNLYTLFDDRIKQYDVYQVETIGDAYMVASGLPKRNGNLHAAEISTMALDLLENIHSVEIPHLPGFSFKLRIGLHTGPVVAGMVGYKMPRYCLFGDTVTIASRMEHLGASGRVHISQTTCDILLEMGGFFLELRKDDVISRDRRLSLAMKGNLSSYWLLRRVNRSSDFFEIGEKPRLNPVVAGKATSVVFNDSGVAGI